VGVPRNKILTLSKNPFEFYLVTFCNLDCIDCITTIFGTQYDYAKSIWLKYDLTFGTSKTTKYKRTLIQIILLNKHLVFIVFL